jgi:uncharacterized membrane protein YsdA (DUF1294 family)
MMPALTIYIWKEISLRNFSLELIKDFDLLMILFFVTLNVIGFFLIKIDKKRAIHHQWRVPERNFFILALLGGATGLYLGMIFFRHKTKHYLFTRGIAVLIVLNALFFYFIFR